MFYHDFIFINTIFRRLCLPVGRFDGLLKRNVNLANLSLQVYEQASICKRETDDNIRCRKIHRSEGIASADLL